MHEGSSNQHHHNALFSKLEFRVGPNLKITSKKLNASKKCKASDLLSTSGFATACRWFR